MGKNKRLDLIFEKHIGFGVRWDRWDYQLDISIAFPFVTIIIGLGKEL
nr:hypothetical protein 4 [Piscirickettsiaceae bacterium]